MPSPVSIDPSLNVNLAGITLRSPLMCAAGTGGTLDELEDVLDLGHLGAIVTKSITKHERSGNAFPRITWTRGGMLNAIGLANPGLDRWDAEIAPKISAMPIPVCCSIAGSSIEEYSELASCVDAHGVVAAIELNVSCPNVHSGLEIGADSAMISELVASVLASVQIAKVFVKLSPVTVGTPNTIVDLAYAAHEAGAHGITLCNTVPAMGIDIHTRKPILSNVTGGLSGPAIHPIIVRLVHLVYRAFAQNENVPIIAAGGVTRWEDAAEFILAGATAVQIGAGLFADPRCPAKINKRLAKWVAKQGCASITELVGKIDLDA